MCSQIQLDWIRIGLPIHLDWIGFSQNPIRIHKIRGLDCVTSNTKLTRFSLDQKIFTITIMDIQRIIPLIYLIFLDQTDSSSEETTDDNIDLSLFHECTSGSLEVAKII